jgi:cyclohexanone monooxygenase
MSLTPEDLLSENPEVLGFDPDALRARYNSERDRRLRPDGAAQYTRVEAKFGNAEKDPYTPWIERDPIDGEVEVLIIGGGFAGLLAGAYLRRAGIEDLRLLDAGGDFGGTWYWNRYPNAQCDTESYIYLPLLEEVGYMPTRNYSYGPEIFEHARAIGRRYNLYRNALFQTEVVGACWDEEIARWLITTDRGDRICARHLVLANGGLTRPKLPDLSGIDRFEGHMFHTSRWDYAYTGGDATGGLKGLADKRVGLVGTGATAIQCVPPLAAWAKELLVFQRTPSAIGVRGNRLTDPDWAATLEPGWQRRRSEHFTAAVEGREVPETFPGDGWIDLIASNQKAIRSLRGSGRKLTPEELARVTANADYAKVKQVHERIESIVRDPVTAELLKPWYRPLCKRPCFHDEYLDTFNRPNVHLVDAASGGVVGLTEKGVIVDGQVYEVDCVIFATGFEVSSSIDRRSGFDLIGRDGLTLSRKWANGYVTQFGFTTAGFPNCYFMTRTQAPLPQNIPTLLEEAAVHIAYLIERTRARGARTIENTVEGEQKWQEEMALTRKNIDRFYSDCTPGYYNNEGQSAKGKSFYGGLYGGGTIRFFQILRSWRDSGELEGMVLDMTAADSAIATPVSAEMSAPTTEHGAHCGTS